MLKKKRVLKKSEKGMAFVEAIPVLFMVVVVFNFSLGFFGAIHSGILNSIASYNYAMETFRFRSNLMYFRPGGGLSNYQLAMNRVHGITADGVKNDDTRKKIWPATVRAIAFSNTNGVQKIPFGGDPDQQDKTFQNRSNATNVWKANSTYEPDSESGGPETPEIWIKTVYGMCLNAECKP